MCEARDVTAPIPKIGPADTLPHLPRTRSRRNASVVLGDYQILSLLARGGTSSVYLAAHLPTERRVAIKILDPQWARHEDLAERMFGEWQIASRVQHRGLVEIYGAAFAPDGTPYLVMELLDGENLGELVDRGRVVCGAIAAIGAQVAEAVAHLHDAGVVHCDIKPDNIFVLYDPPSPSWPHVKLVDYGVSRLLSDPPRETIAGTPSCMSPEHWRSQPAQKADVYSLGCTLYWLATGAAPFSGTLPQLMTAHTQQLPERLSLHRRDVPAELERLVARALSKDPDLRPAMRDLARDLAALAGQFTAGAHPHLLEAAG